MTQSVEAPRKPVPQPDDASRAFFDGARRGVLMIQQCGDCQTWLAPGSMFCWSCLSDVVEWAQASGRGTLFTFAVMHQKYHPAFFDDLPYNIAVVELEEGPRLNTTIIGIPNDQLRVGMAVVASFEDVGEGVSLPKFRPAE